MSPLDKDRIKPDLRERREHIAMSVLAQLVGRTGDYRPEHARTALQAADALIEALDSEGVV